MTLQEAQQRIKYHLEQVDRLEGIEEMLKRRERIEDNLNGFCGTFPELRRKYQHQLEINKLATDRLIRILNKSNEAK